MNLSLKVAKELNSEKDFLMKYEIKINICGNHKLIPKNVSGAFKDII